MEPNANVISFSVTFNSSQFNVYEICPLCKHCAGGEDYDSKLEKYGPFIQRNFSSAGKQRRKTYQMSIKKGTLWGARGLFSQGKLVSRRSPVLFAGLWLLAYKSSHLSIKALREVYTTLKEESIVPNARMDGR